ncbi:zf-HC2 domain-containing protein [Butyrivibrio sp. FC2001]|uniref:zf-HC2 domain-containing protein n=1 Tax=Butyrivibrio sp. FC2001 TaxID=1280671 RepID=UPI000683FD4B|nr:zf-HC2 domain-containing protein [Butyrivibrio sp. FC2001]
MSKFECELVADLLPRYIDKKCTQETTEFIEDHIKSCEECRELFEVMNTEIIGVTEDKPAKRRRLSGGIKVLLVVLGYLGIVIVALMIFSYILMNGVL